MFSINYLNIAPYSSTYRSDGSEERVDDVEKKETGGNERPVTVHLDRGLLSILPAGMYQKN